MLQRGRHRLLRHLLYALYRFGATLCSFELETLHYFEDVYCFCRYISAERHLVKPIYSIVSCFYFKPTSNRQADRIVCVDQSCVQVIPSFEDIFHVVVFVGLLCCDQTLRC
jgi:hypothetical protein